MNISDLRQDYKKNTLNIADTGNDPVRFFKQWLDEAIRAEIPDPTAMSLSTVSYNGRPSSRIVLLKGIQNNNFIFYSNYESTKGKQIDGNPFVSLLFFWSELERQVRVEGVVERVTADESDIYFDSRPLQNRISAVVSPQSHVIQDREELEEKFRQFGEQLVNSVIVRPEYWGGYRVIPEMVEFWQGRASRLHDRIRFRKSENIWLKERLAP